MSSRRRRLLLFAVACATFAPAAAATAAGPPLPTSASGRAGAVAPGGSERLLARRAGEDTVVVAVRRGDRQVLRSRKIDGRWSVAPVTVDGRATTGLSADGRVLVLARPEQYFPPTSTALAVLDARQLLVRRKVSLPGFFAVDAISPNGRWLYLIQYPGQNVLDYRVRALDTRTGRLAARDVVDPREPDEQMGGLPMARVMSPDGRFAYTLYSGDEENFIHALDTVRRTAACIDLAELPPGSDLSGFRLDLSPDGRQVRVLSAGSVVSTVDARAGALGERATAAATQPGALDAPRRAVAQSSDDDGFPWLPLTLAAGLAGLGALAVAITRRRRALAG